MKDLRDTALIHAYAEPHRYYHTYDHVEYMLSRFTDKVSKLRSSGKRLEKDDQQALILAILYHDYYWQPGDPLNEEKSYEAYVEQNPHTHLDPEIRGLIMATKFPFEPKTELEKLMLYLDWSHFKGEPWELSRVNMQIFKEFQHVPFDKYAQGRDTFLAGAKSVPQKMVGQYVSQAEADVLVEGITKSAILSEAFRPKIGIYVGSFNPFHDGHAHILKKAEKVLDKVIVVQAQNASKPGAGVGLPPNILKYRQTADIPPGEPLTNILKHLVTSDADYYLVRGIRNGTDLADEQSYMQTIQHMGVTIPVMHFLCDPDFQHISSTKVRALESVGFDLYRECWKSY